MRFADIKQTGGSVKLFEAFLEKKQEDELALTEAGYDYDTLAEAIASGAPVEEDLLESGSTGDFGAYLSNLVTKRLMWGYQDEP